MGLSREGLPLTLEVAGAMHIGRRHAHQDEYGYAAALGLLAVADGVSTRPAGRVAAETAIRVLFSHLNNPRAPLLADPRERLERVRRTLERRGHPQVMRSPRGRRPS